MTTTSRIPAVIDALVTTLTAALSGVKVYDGPPVTKPTSTISFVTVGWTPTGDTTTGGQERADSGGGARVEHIEVPCYCDAYSGTTTTKTRRDAAFALMAAAETALAADQSLGGAVTGPGWAEIGGYTEYQEQTDKGLTVGIVFHVVVGTTHW